MYIISYCSLKITLKRYLNHCSRLWTLHTSELKSQLTVCDIINKKGIYISGGMGGIQSFNSAEKRPQWPLCVLTKLNLMKT